MTTFGIDSARTFFDKLIEEQRDFEKSNCLSARHAINAVMTAYHLHEWVWGSLVRHRLDLHEQWQLSPGKRTERDDFLRWLQQQCPAIADARKVTNGSKHFDVSKIPTGEHKGAFQRSVFQPNAFDVSYLWIERSDGGKQTVEKFISELVDFWCEFLQTYPTAGRERPPVGRRLEGWPLVNLEAMAS